MKRGVFHRFQRRQKMQFKKKQNYGFFSFLLNKGRLRISCRIILIVFVLILNDQGIGFCLGWPEIKTRLLPDESFALIESNVGTRIRHSPHHDMNGNIDAEQLIYVLGAIDQETWLYPKNMSIVKKHLEKHYGIFKTMAMKKGLNAPVNINEASLTELVLLPQIGPVLAVKIFEYRNKNGLFMSTEKIKKVEGIGQGTFNAIRHYINTD